MTKFACRYGVDPARPDKGYIVESAADDKILDMTGRPGCLYLELPGVPEQWGRFGPEPELMGEPPTGTYPNHDELDQHGTPDDHRLRQLAGLPVPDNRRRAADMRDWAAPDLTPDVARLAKRLEMAAALGAAAVGGFDSAVLGGDEPHRYPSDDDGERKLQMAALAALAGQSKPGWTATLRCAETRKEMVDGKPKVIVGAFLGVAHTAAEVHAVLADYQAFHDALHAERDAVEARIATAATVGDILAVTRG